MPEQAQDKRPHLVLTKTSKAQPFTAPSAGGGSSAEVPKPDRAQHGAGLQAQLQALRPVAQQAVEVQKEQGLQSGLGLQIQFVGMPNVELAFESLGDERNRDPGQQIEVLSVRAEGNTTVANVYVPDGKLDHFEKYVAEYLAAKTNKKGDLIDHGTLLNAISSIRSAELRALWTDEPELLPQDVTEQFWWEVWLPVRGRRNEVVEDFHKLATLAECQVSAHQINFPERTVVLMFGSQQQLSTSVMTLNCVAELRRAKETAEFFDSMTPPEQQQWVDETLARLNVAPENDVTPRVCLLDSGVNRGHPLLAPFLAIADLHTVDPTWGVDDTANHGSGLAGLAALGDLSNALSSGDPVVVHHRLESVKLTPEQGANGGDAKHHGYLFAEAVARPEVAAPARPRVFTSAVTSSDDRDRGRPSAWSSTVDRLAADYDGDGQFPRLFVLCAGNTEDQHSLSTYPASLSTNGIRDPGQAWNALTVGAYTKKVLITEADAQGLASIAPEGGLSPYTSTSAAWSTAWPLKPEVVFEGGNAGKDALGAVGIPSLHLLTTNNLPIERLFATTNATSAASALGARLAGQLMAAYPALRPETIRGLIVHSAEWTDAMRAAYLPTNRPATKTDHVSLIRHCGWGAPQLDRALWSAGNSLTLVLEDQVHPYQKVKGKGVVSKDMNLHSLPWPKEQLQALAPGTKVELRITLSYFIEPNPSARGTSSRFHYPSHRLRFDVQRPLDATTEDFVARINAAAEREDDGDPIDPKDPNWILGDRQRHRGSLHQDIWQGTAAELASRGFIAVYPAKGWWRTRQAQERYDLPARYSLIVSIRTPETNVDLYTPIAQQVATQVAVPVVVNT
ncbi:S8 family peptidase [Variovorax sp. OV700]|uniref:S8 family peptidase n=1 Tax=Variovorax sp. OV700 TaxID=1882826 RepID=UPI0008895AC7|nr:S8 family peptidase [Variovorax sp. OV700]SDI01257.1 Subtilase family protein [Variovorax sp. OV700]